MSDFLLNLADPVRSLMQNFFNKETLAGDANLGAEGPESQQFLRRLEDLSDLKTKDVMIPRALVEALDADLSVERISRGKPIRHNYMPVYRGDMDQIVGIVSRRFLLIELQRDSSDKTVADLMSAIHGVNENLPINQLLNEFVKHAAPFFVVFNELGQTVGFVFLQNALEILFGVEFNDGLDMVIPSSENELPIVELSTQESEVTSQVSGSIANS